MSPGDSGHPMVVWLTGLSGSGKTTLSDALYRLLKPRLPEVVVLDGDAIRGAFGNDLGYTEHDRVTQVTRLQRVAKLLSDQNLVVIVGVVYANPDLLAWNRRNLAGYFEVYLHSSLDTVIERDSKGLYRRVLSGETANVVGVDIPWHPPASPDLILNCDNPEAPDQLARRVAAAVPSLAAVLERI